MITRDMMLKILGQMDTPSIIKALSVSGIQVQPNQVEGGEASGDPTLDGMAVDTEQSRIPGWSELKIAKGPDDRPALADKPYLDMKDKQPPPGPPAGGPNEFLNPGAPMQDPYGYDPGSGA